MRTQGEPQCPYCHRNFTPSPYRPQQRVCSRPLCQQQRRRDYHRQKLASDAEYRQTCRDSRQKWRARNPHYQSRYRQRHPNYVEGNRQRQRLRDRRRRLDGLVKNNLAFDVKRLEQEIWLVSPGAAPLVKNNLAFAELMIFQKVGASLASAR